MLGAQVRRIYTAACMRTGDGAKENDYGHMKSLHGKIEFAFPFRANRWVHVCVGCEEWRRSSLDTTRRANLAGRS
jgi:hypothetical protein